METLDATFAVASGSIAGREHVRLHRNNQDGVALRVTDEHVVVVVTDGCSSGPSSEVGARLGAAWLAEHCGRLWSLEPDEENLCRAAARGLTEFLAGVARSLCARPETWKPTVNDHLLFTFLVALIGPRRALVFGLGDGLVSVNGKTITLDAGPENAPPYLAYRLVGAWPEPEIHHSGPADAIDTLLIATDGLHELTRRPDLLEALENDPRYEKNPSLLHKRLVLLSQTPGLLQDDATAALIRRRRRP